MGASVDIEIGEQRDVKDLSTYRERTQATSSLSLTSTSELVGVSSHPSIIVSTIGMIMIYQEFLKHLVDS